MKRKVLSLVGILALIGLLFSVTSFATFTDSVAMLPMESPPPIYETLEKGDKGDEVLLLQERLVELGFQPGTPDGQYGNKTENAVKQFQILIGLDVTGVADQETQEYLWDEQIIELLPTSTPTPQPTAKPTPEPEPEPETSSAEYILNKNTKKFHYAWCSSVDQMKEKNKVYFDGTREQAIKKGYVPCKRCDP